MAIVRWTSCRWREGTAGAVRIVGVLVGWVMGWVGVIWTKEKESKT